jgi:hypothetical protein
MILPVDAADWQYVLSLAASRVDEARSREHDLDAANAARAVFARTVERVGPVFKTRNDGLVAAAERWARAYIAGEPVERLERFLAEREARTRAAAIIPDISDEYEAAMLAGIRQGPDPDEAPTILKKRRRRTTKKETPA